jgi:hypothetical protein
MTICDVRCQTVQSAEIIGAWFALHQDRFENLDT